jgi:uncharacterized protein
METTINWKKIGLYILLSFGISWMAALLMKLLDIEYSSTAAKAMIGLLFMPGPAIAVFIIQRFIYKEGFEKYGWSFNKSDIKKYLEVALWFLLLTALCLTTIAFLGNTHLIDKFGQLDFSQASFDGNIKQLAAGNLPASLPKINPSFAFIIIILGGLISSITFNLPFMFGEEFGWRGLLLKETQGLGFIPSCLFIGLVWGIWHAPIILMGHNYPSNPIAGVGMMCLFTIGLCPIFAYARLKTQSILGPSMLHGMINSTAAIYLLFIINKNEFCSSIAGWSGVIAGTLFCIGIYLFDKKFVKEFSTRLS